MCAAAFPAQAQLKFGGSVLDHDVMMSGDFADMSRTHPFGTSRAMALGGAFASLGGDMTAMFVNPAGLGMYRSNEITLTPMMSFTHSETAGTLPYKGDNKNRFSMADVGIALNVYQSPSKPLTSLTVGFGLNRVADFNKRYSFSSESRYDPNRPDRLMPTIADVFGQQLGQNGIFPTSDGSLGYNGVNPYFWPAVLGYNAYMISPYTDGEGNPLWVPDCTGSNASVLHSNDVVSSGSINEFAFSVGANFGNIVYVGATLGFQSVHREQSIYYQEEYGYFDAAGNPTAAVNSSGEYIRSQLDYAGLYQKTVLDGSGVNFKIGVIVRPTPSLRLGVAFHTPTFYSLDRTYEGDVESSLYNNETKETKVNVDWTPILNDEGGNSWDFVSPSRLMFGASYTFGTFALVTVDYERDWYNGIRVKNVPVSDPAFMIYPESYKTEFKSNFRGTNTVRAGVEVKPLPILALRAGGGYTDSMFKDGSLYFNAPYTTESYYFSAGVGVSLSRAVTLDVAYQNLTEKQTAYQLFFSLDQQTGEMKTFSGLYDTKYTRHFVSMTLGFRF